jgi:hypothetical protein
MSRMGSSVANNGNVTLTYQRLNISWADEDTTDEDDDDDDFTTSRRNPNVVAAARIMSNFRLMSVLFSLNHGCVVACLALASPKLGAIGAWQSGILYITYTTSALIGATYIVKELGGRNALSLGMGLYCAYVGCFVVALIWPESKHTIPYVGGAIGGVGAGFLWTAQGSYFAKCSELHSSYMQQPVASSTSSLAGIFAFLYLAIEVAVRMLSTILLEFCGTSWDIIFGIYTTIALLSTLGMRFLVQDLGVNQTSTTNESTWFYRLTATAHILFKDPKMKYMIGLNATFGLASAFLNSYVNSQVLPIALNDPDSKYVGVLSSWVSALAAGMSLFFGRIAPISGKGMILILGSVCFFCEVLPFLLLPDIQQWGWTLVILVYSLHGIGRSTFEGTLKAAFADFFPEEKEGAFANINLQNGLSGAIGYISKWNRKCWFLVDTSELAMYLCLCLLTMAALPVSFSLVCLQQSRSCVQYTDGSLHDVGKFQRIIVFTTVLAVVGYWRAAQLYHKEEQARRRMRTSSSSSRQGSEEDEDATTNMSSLDEDDNREDIMMAAMQEGVG